MDSSDNLRDYDTCLAAESSGKNSNSNTFQLVDVSDSYDSGYDGDIEIRQPDGYEEPSSPFSEKDLTGSTTTPNDTSDSEIRLSARFSDLQCDPEVPIVSAQDRYRATSEAPQVHRKRISTEISDGRQPQSMRSSAPPEAGNMQVIDLRDDESANLRQVKRLRKSAGNNNRSRIHRMRDSYRAGSGSGIQVRSEGNRNATNLFPQTKRDGGGREAMDLG